MIKVDRPALAADGGPGGSQSSVVQAGSIGTGMGTGGAGGNEGVGGSSAGSSGVGGNGGSRWQLGHRRIRGQGRWLGRCGGRLHRVRRTGPMRSRRSLVLRNVRHARASELRRPQHQARAGLPPREVSGAGPCPACVQGTNPNIAARCDSGHCKVFDVRKVPEYSGVFNRRRLPFALGARLLRLWRARLGRVGIGQPSGEQTISKIMCAPMTGCAACVPVPPPDYVAACNCGRRLRDQALATSTDRVRESSRGSSAVGVRIIVRYKLVRAAVSIVLALLLGATALSGGADRLRSLAEMLRDHVMGAWSVHLADLLVRASTPRHLEIAAVALAADGSFALFEGWALRRGFRGLPGSSSQRARRFCLGRCTSSIGMFAWVVRWCSSSTLPS